MNQAMTRTQACIPKRSRICICQICDCGRHRCPFNGAGPSTGASGLTEYRCRFEKYHNAHPPDSFKPRSSLISGDEPVEGLSTHRRDYVRHPYQVPYVYRQTYFPPDGDMELLTSYTKEFTTKPLKPAEKVVHKSRYVVGGDFNGLPTYRVDYPRWPMPPRHPKHRYDYTPPDCDFDGDSSYRSTYTTHPGARPADIIKPPDTAFTDGEFQGRTNYRDDFINHGLPPRETPPAPVYQPNTVPLDDLTHYRKEFTGRKGKRAESFKPNDTFHSADPFQGLSTHQSDYIKWKTVPPEKYKEKYQPPEGCMETTTVSRLVFQPPKLPPPKRAKFVPPRRGPGLFHGATSYRHDYQRWQVPPDPRHKPAPYYPTDAPMDTIPSYRAAYTGRHAPAAEICRPPPTGIAEAPFTTITEYKDQYPRKKAHQCPAIRLLARPPGSKCQMDPHYLLTDTDMDTGHQYFINRDDSEMPPEDMEMNDDDEKTYMVG